MKMKIRILSVCCAALFVACVVLSIFVIRGSAGQTLNSEESSAATSPLPAGESSDDIQFKLSLLHLYYESKDVVSTLPFTTIQVSQGALIQAFVSGSDSTTAALKYIDNYYDRTIASAYGTMDEILVKYQLILKKYNIACTSSYTSKYNNLSSMFSSLKNSSNELISRTKTLIKASKTNDYDTYYTSYTEQIIDLTDKIESYCNLIMNEYDTLLSDISSDYDILY